MGKPYNGHKNYNCWNVSLWLGNDEGLYRLVQEVLGQTPSKDVAARELLRVLPEKTPDGVAYNLSNVRLALAGW